MNGARKKPNIYPILLVIFFVSCGKSTEISSSGLNSTVTNISVGKWTSSQLPITLNITNAITPGEASDVQSMGNAWENATNNSLNFFNFGAQVANRDLPDLDDYLDEEMGVYLKYSWPSDLSYSALAITQYYGYKRNVGSANPYIELVHADILLNSDFFQFSFDNTPDTYDLPSVVLHEMGHFIGLPHNNNYFSVMYPSLGMNMIERTLYASDITAIKNNYGLGLDTSALTSLGFGTLEDHQRDNDHEQLILEDSDISEGDFVRGHIELQSNGLCIHRVVKIKSKIK